ncbi:MAG: D-tyrosyl-tRNA(Tyr) deacylase [Gemmatimonadetes bacterium]|nr:D-tyrosyl-tRNA(Tyr) deacylase [Gemmatimonadota bacterium]
MRAILQRVAHASVEVEGSTVGEIGRGLLVLVGVATGDDADDVAWIARKLTELRIFPDDAGRMNRSVGEVGGSILLVPNFTVAGDCTKGRRPSFDRAMAPEVARPAFEAFAHLLVASSGVTVRTGVFGAHMHVALENDGPITLVLERAPGGPSESG